MKLWVDPSGRLWMGMEKCSRICTIIIVRLRFISVVQWWCSMNLRLKYLDCFGGEPLQLPRIAPGQEFQNILLLFFIYTCISYSVVKNPQTSRKILYIADSFFFALLLSIRYWETFRIQNRHRMNGITSFFLEKAKKIKVRSVQTSLKLNLAQLTTYRYWMEMESSRSLHRKKESNTFLFSWFCFV